MLSSIGPMEIIVVLAIALMVLGPKRLPGAGKSIGHGLREFKSAISGADERDAHAEHDLAPVIAASEPVAATPPRRTEPVA